MSALRAASVGVLAALALLATQCDFGIDTKGLAGDGQAPIDASPAEAGDAAPASEAAPDAPTADAIDETTAIDAPAEATADGGASDAAAD